MSVHSFVVLRHKIEVGGFCTIPSLTLSPSMFVSDGPEA